jgi:hypothetical protein
VVYPSPSKKIPGWYINYTRTVSFRSLPFDGTYCSDWQLCRATLTIIAQRQDRRGWTHKHLSVSCHKEKKNNGYGYIVSPCVSP